MTRLESLMLQGEPRYIRCYDNGGKSIDRYTVVFTGRYRHNTGGECVYLSMNAAPFHPQGFGQHGSSKDTIDRPTYSHLGKKVKFASLPEDCKRLVLEDYAQLWDLIRCACCGTVVEDAKSWGDGDFHEYSEPSYCSEKCYRTPLASMNKTVRDSSLSL